ncbi:hypothetical protein ACLQ2R_29575 [Streptosporangium sp. DT93]|uniref:hypothetical protein n=1 Tax=Streptosporangium sp. DT93 TaxID=3393428 RepID=UPI003CE8BA35
MSSNRSSWITAGHLALATVVACGGGLVTAVSAQAASTQGTSAQAPSTPVASLALTGPAVTATTPPTPTPTPSPSPTSTTAPDPDGETEAPPPGTPADEYGEPDTGTEEEATTFAAATITRSQMIARARTWNPGTSKRVPYSQSKTRGGYRTDCSGYVSMALGLGKPGPITVGLAKSTYSKRITMSQLRRGDLVIDAIGSNTTRHVVIFDKWANAGKTSYWAYEQRGGYGTDYRTRTYGLASGSQYKAYRANKIREDAPKPPATVTRAQVVARAKTWKPATAQRVPYSQTRLQGGYRADGSGYVSMTLGLAKPGPNTVALAKSAYTRPIAMTALLQGDLVIDPVGGTTARAVVIFDKWADAKKTSYWAYQQRAGYGTDYRVVKHGLTAGTQFKAYRSLRIR